MWASFNPIAFHPSRSNWPLKSPQTLWRRHRVEAKCCSSHLFFVLINLIHCCFDQSVKQPNLFYPQAKIDCLAKLWESSTSTIWRQLIPCSAIERVIAITPLSESIPRKYPTASEHFHSNLTKLIATILLHQYRWHHHNSKRNVPMAINALPSIHSSPEPTTSDSVAISTCKSCIISYTTRN